MSKNNNLIIDANNELIKYSPLYQAWTQKVGVNSKILLHQYHHNGEVKVVAKFGASKGGFSVDEAVDMIDDVLEYEHKLRQQKIPLPQIEDIILEYNHLRNKALIIKTSAWTGNDVGKIITHDKVKDDHKQIKKIIQEMLSIIFKIYFKKISKWELELGIDSGCNNFTVDKNGKMWFVDLFPPRHRKHDMPIVEWPFPKSKLGWQLGHFKHFDKRGILLCFIAQLSRVRPDLRHWIEKVVFSEAKNIFSEEELSSFMSELENTPWLKLRNLLSENKISLITKKEISKIIKNSLNEPIFGVDYNVYTLREIALELATQDLMNNKELEDFFKISHFEDELPKQKIEELKSRLIFLV